MKSVRLNDIRKAVCIVCSVVLKVFLVVKVLTVCILCFQWNLRLRSLLKRSWVTSVCQRWRAKKDASNTPLLSTHFLFFIYSNTLRLNTRCVLKSSLSLVCRQCEDNWIESDSCWAAVHPWCRFAVRCSKLINLAEFPPTDPLLVLVSTQKTDLRLTCIWL